VTFLGTVTLINYPGSDVPVWWNVNNTANVANGAAVIGHIMSADPIDTQNGGTMFTGSLLTLNSVTFNGGSSVTSQARTYPNSYAGVIGERIIVLF
jgi:hypothetical protein